MSRTMLWLLPDDETAGRLRTCMDALAGSSEYALPRFDPHLTLATGTRGSTGAVPLSRLTSHTPLTLRILRVHAPAPSTPGFTPSMSLYLEVAGSPALEDLVTAAEETLGAGERGRRRTPHVSLAYTGAPASAKVTWIEACGLRKLEKTPLRFDRVRELTYTRHQDFAQHMASWRVFAEAGLRG